MFEINGIHCDATWPSEFCSMDESVDLSTNSEKFNRGVTSTVQKYRQYSTVEIYSEKFDCGVICEFCEVLRLCTCAGSVQLSSCPVIL